MEVELQRTTYMVTSRRSRTPDRATRRLALYYGAAVLLGIGAFLLIHWLLSGYFSTLHWSMRLTVAMGGLLGFFFSWVGAWRAHSADRRTKQLLSKLEETNKIVRESPRSYTEVFDYHVLKPLSRAAEARPEEAKNDHMNLILSTPAYGYHVLGLEAHGKFQKGLEQARCNKQIILFSPDAHYFHVANTLLWYPLRKEISEEQKPKDKSQEKEAKVEPIELFECILDTMEILEHQVKWSEKHDETHVGVWTTDQAVFRLTSFEFGDESDAYVVLTDAVTLTSDLNEFNGRVLAVPDTLYRHLVGFHKDPDSFIDKIKWCPYSLQSGEEARLQPDELERLKYDYILIRTEQVLFDVACFDSQLRRIISMAWRHRKDLDANQHLPLGVEFILGGVVEYFEELLREDPERDWNPQTEGAQFKKLEVLTKIRQILRDSRADFAARAKSFRDLLETEASRVDDWFEKYLTEYFQRQTQEHDPATAWIGTIYYLMTCGFRESEFAKTRRERFLPLPTTEVAAEPPDSAPDTGAEVRE